MALSGQLKDSPFGLLHVLALHPTLVLQHSHKEGSTEMPELAMPRLHGPDGRFVAAPRQPDEPVHEAYRNCPHFEDAPWNTYRDTSVYTSWQPIRVIDRDRTRPGGPYCWRFVEAPIVGDPWGCHQRVHGWQIHWYDYSREEYVYSWCTECPPPTECSCYSCQHPAGECDCDSCYADRMREEFGELIHNYGYKPLPTFYGQGPVFMGVELELEGPEFQAAAQVVPMIDGRAYLKEDGSVDGFELVTHPHSLAAHAKDFGWSDVLRTVKNEGMAATSACGLHVHVSRDAFSSASHAFRWQSLLYRNQDAVIRVARRNSEQWARWPDRARYIRRAMRRGEPNGLAREMRELSKGIKNLDHQWSQFPEGLDRYRALNFNNSATVELRCFASTTDIGELFSALELVTASVEYTRKMPTVPRATALSLPAFRDYVSGSETYSNLAHVL